MRCGGDPGGLHDRHDFLIAHDGSLPWPVTFWLSQSSTRLLERQQASIFKAPLCASCKRYVFHNVCDGAVYAVSYLERAVYVLHCAAKFSDAYFSTLLCPAQDFSHPQKRGCLRDVNILPVYAGWQPDMQLVCQRRMLSGGIHLAWSAYPPYARHLLTSMHMQARPTPSASTHACARWGRWTVPQSPPRRASGTLWRASILYKVSCFLASSQQQITQHHQRYILKLTQPLHCKLFVCFRPATSDSTSQRYMSGFLVSNWLMLTGIGCLWLD